jgi:hypothetical protein
VTQNRSGQAAGSAIRACHFPAERTRAPNGVIKRYSGLPAKSPRRRENNDCISGKRGQSLRALELGVAGRAVGRRARLRIPKSSISKRSSSFQKQTNLRGRTRFFTIRKENLQRIVGYVSRENTDMKCVMERVGSELRLDEENDWWTAQIQLR